jgi:hypothetical protein
MIHLVRWGECFTVIGMLSEVCELQFATWFVMLAVAVM